MRDLPSDLETAAVLEALRDGWGLAVEAADYAAVGAGSYHWLATDAGGTRRFVTVDDLDQKRWLGETRDAAYEALGRAFDTAVALRNMGLEFVVAPVPTNGGESLRRIGERHTVALFPFVDGQAGTFGEYEPGAQSAVVSILAELHLATPAVGSGANSVGLELPGRRRLEAGLCELDRPWSGGLFSEPARRAFARRATDVADLLALADRLAAEVEERGDTWVVTHGEPHSANVMRVGTGHALVDWDTVALAPRERDLWMVADDPEDLAAYTDATSRDVDRVALDFFRLTWDLKDLAEYLNVVRSPHDENEDTLRAYESLTTSGPSREEWL